MTSPAAYRFGPFRFDAAAYRLLAGGRDVPLSPRVMDLLRLLASRPSQLVTRDDILRELWPDVHVTDNAVTQVVSDLRHALGDDPGTPSYVQTVPRRGYRFIAAVHRAPARADASLRPVVPADPVQVRRIAGVADFVNVSADAADDWLAAGLAETLTGDLRGLPGLSVLDRAHLAPAVRSASIPAARGAGIDLLVAGSVQRAGRRLRLTARGIDTRSGEAVAHAKADGRVVDVFGLQDAVVVQLRRTLEASLGDHTPSAREPRDTSVAAPSRRAVTSARPAGAWRLRLRVP